MKKFTVLLLCLGLLLAGCTPKPGGPTPPGTQETQGPSTDLGNDDTGFGQDLKESGFYDGYFEGASADLQIQWISGTKDAYKLEGTTLTFTAVSEETVYALSGTFSGNIVIDVGEDQKFRLELTGLALVSGQNSPITVLSGDEVTIQAQKSTQNYIYDTRPAAEEGQYAAAIYAEPDLEISGKGALTVVSENNNGIRSKDDLRVKNLTLSVACRDNALKGNDSVRIEGGKTVLIAVAGDCIKTENSDISQKGNQRGTVTVAGGTHELFAACDGIDSAYDVIIEDGTTTLSIYTDKYSNYSQEVADASSDTNYIRFTSDRYCYSVKYYNSETDYLWVNAEYHSKVSGGRTTYYYYSYPKMPEYAKQQFFIYESAAQQGQDQEYLVMSDYLTPNAGCDTFALSQSYNGLRYEWTNYTTKIQDGGPGGRPGGFGGPGGFDEGNSDKSDHSAKGIKAANAIAIHDGTVNIKAHDDAIHANGDTALENGATPLGDVTVHGGNLTLYSSDDGIHADGTLAIHGGTVSITNAYEGLEGACVRITGGYVSVLSKDDGINATATTGNAVTVSGGTVYICCTGDGIDSNSRTADEGIIFAGGRTVVISNSGMNSAIDSENGYTYEGGAVVAVMPRGGMSNEATHCDNFNSIGTSKQISLNSGAYLQVQIGDETVTVQMPVSLSALVIALGDQGADIRTASAADGTPDSNGVTWR